MIQTFRDLQKNGSLHISLGSLLLRREFFPATVKATIFIKLSGNMYFLNLLTDEVVFNQLISFIANMEENF